MHPFNYLLLLLNLLLPTISSAAGIPTSPQQKPTSILLFNCSIPSHDSVNYHIESCSAQLKARAGFDSCLSVSDLDKFEELGVRCSHYLVPLNRRSDLGTRVSFDVPDRVKNLCEECEKKKQEGGDCGAGWKCLCHPQMCRDRVVYGGGRRKMGGDHLGLLAFAFTVIWVLVVGV